MNLQELKDKSTDEYILILVSGFSSEWGFSHESSGMHITNPWLSENGMDEVADPLEYYGKEFAVWAAEHLD